MFVTINDKWAYTILFFHFFFLFFLDFIRFFSVGAFPINVSFQHFLMFNENGVLFDSFESIDNTTAELINIMIYLGDIFLIKIYYYSQEGNEKMSQMVRY